MSDADTQTLAAESTLDERGYVAANMLLGWDTSTLPPDLVVTNAWLRLFVQSAADTDHKGLTGDWYAWGPDCDASDHTNDAPSNALSVDGACGTSCDLSAVVASRDNDFPLDGVPEQIDRAGATYLRLHVSLDQVTGPNGIEVAGSSSEAPGPRLVLLLCQAPLSPTGTPTPTPVPTPTPP